MFDFSNTRHVDGKTIVDQTLLNNALAALSDEDLNQLEDELNFARFAGLPSARILSLLDELMELDSAWKAQLKRQTANAA
ncbi:MAG: hypothetical protein OIF48_08520 [Silicimonas sp.]|nr:hypothetical protein [Silicimonas sp.]